MSTASADDERHMARAIRLAMRGRGHVEPNPMVGCVIVKGGREIGAGYHERFGGPHAEPNALVACAEPPAGATAYVTLEPCCHTNKKTPPCVPALIGARLARVVVGCVDPNPNVSGNGIRQLREAGVEVTVGVCEAEAKQFLAPFIAGVTLRRPYVTLKWAESADGKVAGPAGRRTWISNLASRRIVHELRSRCDAILVGVGTVLADDPALTVRDVPPLRAPMRVVLDRALRTPTNARIFADGPPAVVFCGHDVDPSRIAELTSVGAQVIKIDPGDRGVDLQQVLHHLYLMSVTHLLVEPGPTLGNAFLREHLADRVWRFVSARTIGDVTAPSAPAFTTLLKTASHIISGGADAADELEEYLDSAGPLFFAPTPSADFHLLLGDL